MHSKGRSHCQGCEGACWHHRSWSALIAASWATDQLSGTTAHDVPSAACIQLLLLYDRWWGWALRREWIYSPQVALQSKPRHPFMHSPRQNRRVTTLVSFPVRPLDLHLHPLHFPSIQLFLFPSEYSLVFLHFLLTLLLSVNHYSSFVSSSANSAMMSWTQMSLSSCDVSTRNTVSFLSQGLAASWTTSSCATRGFFSTWFLKTMEASSDHCLGFKPAKWSSVWNGFKNYCQVLPKVSIDISLQDCNHSKKKNLKKSSFTSIHIAKVLITDRQSSLRAGFSFTVGGSQQTQINQMLIALYFTFRPHGYCSDS